MAEKSFRSADLEAGLKRCPQGVAARLLGISDRALRDRIKAGTLADAGGGRVDVFAALQAERESSRRSVVSLETARLKRAQAERAEIENRVRLGGLLVTEDVQVALSEILVTIVGMLEGVASRLAAKTASETDPAQTRRLILDEHRRVRAHASERLAGMVPGGFGGGPGAPSTGKKPRSVGRRKPRPAAGKRGARAISE